MFENNLNNYNNEKRYLRRFKILDHTIYHRHKHTKHTRRKISKFNQLNGQLKNLNCSKVLERFLEKFSKRFLKRVLKSSKEF